MYTMKTHVNHPPSIFRIMIKIKANLWLLSGLLFLAVGATGQDLTLSHDTVRWTTTAYADSLLNVSGETTTVFVTYGNQTVKWIPIAGDPSQLLYDVETLNGSWSAGDAAYTLLRNGSARTLVITRNGTSTTLTMRWTDTAGKKRRLDYTVSEIEKL